MNEAVRTVVHRMGMDASEYKQEADEVARANEQLISTTAKVVVEEERVTRATASTADALARLDARVDAAIRAEQRRAAALAQVNRAVEEGRVTQERAAQTIARVNAYYDAQVAAANRARAANQNLAGAMVAANTNTRGFGSTIQQAGFQVGDFAVQVASGGSAMRAFIQQGSQFLGVFGPMGAVLGAGLAIAGALAATFVGLGDNTSSAKDALVDYEKAIERSNALLMTATELAAAQAEAKRREAIETIDATLAKERETAAQVERQRMAAAEQLRRLEQTSGRGGPATDMRALIQTVRDELSGLEEVASRLQGRIGELITQRQKLEDPSQLGKAREEHEKRARAIETEREKVDSLIKSLELEVETQGMSNRQKEMRIALDRAGAAATEGQRVKIIQLIDAKHDYIDAIKKQQDEERKAAEAAKRAADEQRRLEEESRRAAERAQKEFARQVERGTDRVVGQAADILYDAFEGRIRSVGDLLRSTILRAVAEASAQMIIRPIVQPIVASAIGAFGGGSPAGGGGLGSLLGGGGINPFSIMQGGVGGIWGPGGPFSLSALAQGGGILSPLTSLGSGLAGLAGFSVAGPSTIAAASSLAVGPGGLLAGGGATSLAAGAGSMLAPLAATGIGAIAAIGGGLLLGSLLKGKSSVGPNANANLVLQNGQFAVGRSAADNQGNVQQAIQTTQQLAQALNMLVSTYGLQTRGSGMQLDAGYFKDQLYLGLGGGPGVNMLLQTNDPDALALAAFRQLYARGNITGATGDIARVLSRSQATTLSGLASDLDLAKMLQAPAQSAAQAIADLNRQFDDLAKRARQLGLSEARLNEVRKQQIEAAQAQFDAPIIQGISNVRSLVERLSYGNFSPLSPEEQFRRAERELQAVGSAAAAGDLNSLNAFTGTAARYVEIARERYASSPQFFEAVNKVLGFAGQIGDVSAEGWRTLYSGQQQQTVTLVGELQKLRDEIVKVHREIKQGNIANSRIAA
jgi:hypothetical protein